MKFLTDNKNELAVSLVGSGIFTFILWVIAYLKNAPSVLVPVWVFGLVAIPFVFPAVKVIKKKRKPVPIVDETYSQRRVILDGKKFIRCTFDRCTMVHVGEKNFGMEECGFINCDWAFESEAGTVIHQIKLLHNLEYFQKMFHNIFYKK